MRFFLLSLMCLASVGSVGLSQSLEFTKKATGLDFEPYGLLLTRHYTLVSYDEQNNVASQTPQVHALYVLGSLMYDKKLDLSAVFRIVKEADSTQVRKHPSESLVITGKYLLINSPFVEVSPYANVRVNENSETYGDPGILLAKEFSFSVPAVDFKVKPSFDGWAYMNGTTDDRIKMDPGPREPNRFALTSEVDPSTEETSYYTDKKDMAYGTEYAVDAAVSPKLVNGLTVGSRIGVVQKFNPEYKFNDEKETVEFEKYASVTKTTNEYYISFAFNDSVSLENRVYQDFGGVYKSAVKGEDTPRFVNRVSLNMTLY